MVSWGRCVFEREKERSDMAKHVQSRTRKAARTVVSHTSSRMRIRFARPAWAYALRFMPMYSFVAFCDMFFMPPFYT